MLKLLAFLAIIQLAQSTSSNCDKGPTYWCQSVNTANECGAFKHCVQTVWSTHASYVDRKLTTLRADECKTCVKCLYSDVRRCPNMREFKDEIAVLFENNLPSESICRLIDQCDKKSSIVDKIVKTDMTRCSSENHCANLDMAVRCSVLEQCMQQWTKSPKRYQLKQSKIELPQKELNEENTCGFCIFIMTKYQNVIAQNTTEIDAKNYLESACRLVPCPYLRQKCLDQVSTYLPQIINFLRDNADPGVVCHALQLCRDEHLEEKKFDVSQIRIKIVNPEKAVIKTPLQPKTQLSKAGAELAVKLSNTNGMGCEICTIIFDAAKFLVKNEVDNKRVLQFVEKNLCGRLGEYNETCTAYLQTDGEQIIEFIENEIESAVICASVGLCMKTQVSLARNNPFDLHMKSPKRCQQCQSTMDHVKKMISTEYKNMEVLEFIKEDFCMKGGDMKYLCTSTMDAYSETIMAIIEQDIKSHQLCEMFEVCGEEKISEELYYNLDNPTQFKSDAQEPNNNCVICQFLMKLVDQELYKNTTEIEIKTALDKVCNKLVPSEYKEKCVNLVDTYTDTIIFLLVKKVPAEYVCEIIGVCKQSTHIHEFLKNNNLVDHNKVLIGGDEKLINQMSIQKKPSAQCILCEITVNMMSKVIKDNATEAEIMHELKMVCNVYMPSQLHDECNQFVDAYGQQIIDMIVQKLDPATICTEASICVTSTKKLINQIPTEKNQASAQCVLCEFTINLLSKMVPTNATEAEVMSQLKMVCNVDIPSSLRSQCNELVDTYGQKIIAMINKDDTATICAELKLCEAPAKKLLGAEKMYEKLPSVTLQKQEVEMTDLKPAKLLKSLPNDIKLFEEKKEEESVECTLCIYAAQLTDNFLKKNKTEDEIETELKLVCNYFPKNLAAECDAFISEYGPYVIQLIAADLDPEQVCAQLNLCGHTNKKSERFAPFHFKKIIN